MAQSYHQKEQISPFVDGSVHLLEKLVRQRGIGTNISLLKGESLKVGQEIYDEEVSMGLSVPSGEVLLWCP